MHCKSKNFVLAIVFVIVATIGFRAQAGTVTMEAGVVDLPPTSRSSTNFVQVNFTANFSTVPNVFSTATTQGADPAALRIRNVTTTSFEMVQVEPPARDPNDQRGPHEGMTDIAWFAVEPGLHILEDGTIIESYKFSTKSSVQSGSVFGDPGGYINVPFQGPHNSSSIVLTNLTSMNNEVNAVPGEPSSPWLTTTVKPGSISPGGFSFALERSEVNDGSDVDRDDDGEMLKLTTTTTGTGPLFGGPVWEGINIDDIAGWDDNGNDGTNGNGTEVFFSQNFSSPPLVIASIMRPAGEDGGWLRRGDVTASSVRLTVDEDQFHDDERGGTFASASILAFEHSFALTLRTVPIPEPSTVLLLGFGSLTFGFVSGRRLK